MPNPKPWHPRLDYYEELIGIKFRNTEDMYKLIEAFGKPKLRTCPRDTILGEAIVFPKEAMQFLSMDRIDEVTIELRQTTAVHPSIQEEVSKRFYDRKGQSNRPHYWKAGDMIVRKYIPLTTVREIAAQIAEAKE